MLRMLFALATIVVGLSSAMTGKAEQRRVAVVHPDDRLLRAISLALSPWSLQTIRSDSPLPQSAQPQAVEAASGLASQLNVDAVVWMTEREQGSLLWVFDVESGEVTTRMISETPPLDDAAAAAVALSVKTVLRASVIAPPEERFGSPAAEADPVSMSALELGAGGYWLSAGEFDTRAELALVAWLMKRRLGLSLEVAGGPGRRLDGAYTGVYREFSMGARLRVGLIETSSFATLVAVGGGARWAMLRGAISDGAISDGASVDVDRVNASVDLETTFNFKLSTGVYLGLSLGASYLPRNRRYLVDGDPVLAPWPVTTHLAGHCGVDLF